MHGTKCTLLIANLFLNSYEAELIMHDLQRKTTRMHVIIEDELPFADNRLQTLSTSHLSQWARNYGEYGNNSQFKLYMDFHLEFLIHLSLPHPLPCIQWITDEGWVRTKFYNKTDQYSYPNFNLYYRL